MAQLISSEMQTNKKDFFNFARKQKNDSFSLAKIAQKY